MSETNTGTETDVGAPAPGTAGTMRLRPEPERVTRISRRVLAGLGIVVGLGIGGALIYALQSTDRQVNHDELFTTDRRQTAADDLNGAADAGERVLDFVGDDCRHLAEMRERRLFAELALHGRAFAQVVEDPGETALAVDVHFADRQVQGKRRPVSAQPGDLATEADDLPGAGGEITRQVRVVLLPVRRRHQDAGRRMQ